MLVITPVVFRYYTERQFKRDGLFDLDRPLSVNVHTIVNLNAGEPPYLVKSFFMARKNDLALLKMVRERESLTRYLFQFQLDSGHRRRYYNFKKWLKKIAEAAEQSA